jgi:hypothetical protein
MKGKNTALELQITRDAAHSGDRVHFLHVFLTQRSQMEALVSCRVGCRATAAMAACRSPKWKPFYESYLARGFSKTQALVALARKLCRVAFALMKNQSKYLSA